MVERVGDKALHELTRADIVAYVGWWEDRIINEGISRISANKNISHLSGMVNEVDRRLQLRLDDRLFSRARIKKVKGVSDSQRPPFSVEHLRNVILAPGALDGLNEEARDVLYVCLETGARPGEVANLSKSHIKLNDAVPHIRIAGEGRLLKTDSSERDIPLVGLALEAMKRHPNGFPRYRDKGSNLSGALMKFFRENDLLETDDHAIYSLRHSFKDRLRAVECPEELTDQLMGHSSSKPRYGRGHTMELKQHYLNQIALKPPSPRSSSREQSPRRAHGSRQSRAQSIPSAGRRSARRAR